MKRGMNRRQAWGAWLLSVATVAAGVMGVAAAAHAQTGQPGASWEAVLAMSPRWQAAQQVHQAALARAQAIEGNPHDWTPQASWAQRSQRSEPGQLATADTREWSIGVSRGVRGPGKAAAAQDWSFRLRDWADAERAQAWLLICREALTDAGEMAMAQQQASLWRAHADNLGAQHQALKRRHELGDAARQDVILADAARAQAESQATLAEQRARSVESRWRGRYPGLVAPTDLTLERDPGPAPDAGDLLPTRMRQHPAWLAAERRVLAMKAQARHAQAERQPDPVLGLQYGRERSGAERVIGVSMTWPIGAATRASQALAQAAEAESAQAELDDLALSLRADLGRWLDQASRAQQAASSSAHALRQTELAEQALRRGQALGQASASEVLQMQRQLIEQRQLAAQASVEAWLAQRKWSLESGSLWADPPVDAGGAQR